jgi:hypothetical protein
LSWGRIASTLTLIAAIIWISYVIYKEPNHHFPAFDGITAFVLGPYASNKVGTAVQSFSNNPVGNKPGVLKKTLDIL